LHARNDLGQGDLWEQGLKRFIAGNDFEGSTKSRAFNDSSINDSINGNLQPNHDEFLRDLIPRACDYISEKNDELNIHCSGAAAKVVFRQVLLHHKPIRLPVFSMFCPTAIGMEIDLRLFEPRYRLMINEVMTGRSDRERSGFPMVAPRPRFVFANRSDTWSKNIVCVVEVYRCIFRRDGIADITIVPVHWAVLSELVQRPLSGGLMDGVVMRAPKRMRLPAFCMRAHLRLGQAIRIRLFEERYKTLIAEVMSEKTNDERNGSVISEPKPQFVFFSTNRFREGSIACLVDIEQCRIHGDRSAHVTVVPTSWVLVESIRVRPKSGKLYDASVFYDLPPVSQV
jgi:Lon protease-like protein